MAMTNRTKIQNSPLLALAMIAFTLAAASCTKSDSLGSVGDGGTDSYSSAGPEASSQSTCTYPTESVLSDAGEPLWWWSFSWTSASPNLATMCAAWGADAKIILEVMFPASTTGTGTNLPICTSDAIATGSGPACSVADSRRFEAACTDGKLLFALPSQNAINAFYHLESTSYPNSRRWTVNQAVEGCVRSVIGLPGPPQAISDGGVVGSDGALPDGGNAPALQGVFVETGSMNVGRENHTATLLGNGKVLIAGGWVHSAVDDTQETASAELYDPQSATFSPTGNMLVARSQHSATLLKNGKVLIAGGYRYQQGQQYLASAEIYDPETGTFTATGSMSTARENHQATLLSNGQVLMTGGDYGASDPPSYPAIVEVYDPATGTFTAAGSLSAGRVGHTATLLTNGAVLVTGGCVYTSFFDPMNCSASAELRDPTSGTFTATSSMTVARNGHTATLLTNGMVLIAGGANNNTALATGELYNPSTGAFTVAHDMAAARSGHTATRLLDGRVLVAGGIGGDGDVVSAELYNPATGLYAATANMVGAASENTATLLSNGTVLFAGGVYGAGWTNIAELYR
jgi:Kelch motif/Galactose oxidase, central domain